jgi:hypothetical protein
MDHGYDRSSAPLPRTEEYRGISYIVRDDNFEVTYACFESEPVVEQQRD